MPIEYPFDCPGYDERMKERRAAARAARKAGPRSGLRRFFDSVIARGASIVGRA